MFYLQILLTPLTSYRQSFPSRRCAHAWIIGRPHTGIIPSTLTGLFLTVNFVQDSGLHDLARKYNVTIEAIALQTRHIVDEMNGKGHKIDSIYMSGGQAKNIPMMQLFADTCGMPVVLPFDHAGAVVLGAAMLGRFASEAQGKGAMGEKEQGEALWKIMVRVLLDRGKLCSLRLFRSR